jgi:hypothetical protein
LNMGFRLQNGMRPDGALRARPSSSPSGAIATGYLDCLRQGCIGGCRTENPSQSWEPIFDC